MSNPIFFHTGRSMSFYNANGTIRNQSHSQPGYRTLTGTIRYGLMPDVHKSISIDINKKKNDLNTIKKFIDLLAKMQDLSNAIKYTPNLPGLKWPPTSTKDLEQFTPHELKTLFTSKDSPLAGKKITYTFNGETKTLTMEEFISMDPTMFNTNPLASENFLKIIQTMLNPDSTQKLTTTTGKEISIKFGKGENSAETNHKDLYEGLGKLYNSRIWPEGTPPEGFEKLAQHLRTVQAEIKKLLANLDPKRHRELIDSLNEVSGNIDAAFNTKNPRTGQTVSSRDAAKIWLLDSKHNGLVLEGGDILPPDVAQRGQRQTNMTKASASANMAREDDNAEMRSLMFKLDEFNKMVLAVFVKEGQMIEKMAQNINR